MRKTDPQKPNIKMKIYSPSSDMKNLKERNQNWDKFYFIPPIEMKCQKKHEKTDYY